MCLSLGNGTRATTEIGNSSCTSEIFSIVAPVAVPSGTHQKFVGALASFWAKFWTLTPHVVPLRTGRVKDWGQFDCHFFQSWLGWNSPTLPPNAPSVMPSLLDPQIDVMQSLLLSTPPTQPIANPSVLAE